MPMTRMEPREWLLGTGEVVREPPLEMSGSGRKIRVAGTTESVYNTEIDMLLRQAVDRIASDKHTTVWLDITGGLEDRIRYAIGFRPAEAKGKLHLVHDPGNAAGYTDLWWRFKDVGTPFEVLLWARLKNHRTAGSVNGQFLHVSLVTPARNAFDQNNLPVLLVKDKYFSEYVNLTRFQGNSDLPPKWQEFVRDNPPDWPVDLLGDGNHPHARAGVAALLKVVREFEAIDEIEVPDMGDPFNPAYRTLKLHGTNVNAELLSDLTEYLDGAPTIEQAAELYQQMLETLRSVGISVQGKSPNDFLAAMLAGEKSTLNMQVFGLSEEQMRVDQDHKLSVHLPTGTFIVECTHQDVDKNQVAEHWEAAKTMASLTGEADELLAYARAYAASNQERRTKSILKERTTL